MSWHRNSASSVMAIVAALVKRKRHLAWHGGAAEMAAKIINVAANQRRGISWHGASAKRNSRNGAAMAASVAAAPLNIIVSFLVRRSMPASYVAAYHNEKHVWRKGRQSAASEITKNIASSMACGSAIIGVAAGGASKSKKAAKLS